MLSQKTLFNSVFCLQNAHLGFSVLAAKQQSEPSDVKAPIKPAMKSI
jgi:hypothetical protein